VRIPEDAPNGAMLNMMNMGVHNSIIEKILVKTNWMFAKNRRKKKKQKKEKYSGK